MSNYDFDINNYNEEDLVKFFKLPKKYTKVTLTTQLDPIFDNIQTPKNKTEQNFLTFVTQSKFKLLNYLKLREPVQFPPTNYDILQSQNVLTDDSRATAVQKIIPVVNTNDYKFPTGVINPVEKRVTTKILNIDTLFRNNYSNSSPTNITWNLSNPITNVISMNIVSLELPNVWYTISSKNCTNAFQITVNNVNLVSSTNLPLLANITANQSAIQNIKNTIVNIVTIPDGNYLSSDFVTAINNYFLNTKNGLNFLVASVDPLTTKTTIRARDKSDTSGYPVPYDTANSYYSPNFSFTVEFLNYGGLQFDCNTIQPFNPLTKTLGWFMGFRNTTYTITKTNTFINNIISGGQPITYLGFLQSESSYGSSLHNYLLIDVDDFNRNFITDSIVSVTTNSYIGNNVLGKIPISSLPNNVIFNNPSDRIFKMREYLGPVNIKRLNVRLLNKFGEVIDINNNDFSMTLEFKILY